VPVDGVLVVWSKPALLLIYSYTLPISVLAPSVG
jgi:hypothetical protein